MDAGFIVPMTSFSSAHIPTLEAALIEHQVTGCKDELDQFIQGLETHQVLSLLRQDDNRASARTLFSGRVKPVTVSALRSILRFKYSEGNAEIGQKATSQGFITFLQATKGSTAVNGIKVQTKDVLMWLTGSSLIPAVGFHKKVDVEFGEFTFVNTCALCLTLKVQPEIPPEDAVQYYTELIINSQAFTKELCPNF